MNYLVLLSLVVSGLIIMILIVKLIKILMRNLISMANHKSKMMFSIINWVGVLLYIVFLNIVFLFYIDIDLKSKDVVVKIFSSVYVFIGILIITKFIISIIVPYLSEKLERISRDSDISLSISIVSNTIWVFSIIVAITIILVVWNVSLVPLITTLGIGGLAVAIALQDTLTNFLAGIQIMLVHQIRIGDYIKIENGDEGFIVDINWRNVTIRELSNNISIIPNSKLISGIVKNFYLPDQEMSIVVPIEIPIENDLTKVEEIVVNVAREIQNTLEGCVKDFEPAIRYISFTGYSVKFSVILRIKEYTYQFEVKHEFLKKLHSKLSEAGVKLSLPVVNIRNTDV